MEDYGRVGETGHGKRNLIWLLVIVAVAVFGLLLSKGVDTTVNTAVDNMTTITGTFACLPTKSLATATSTPANCTLGVKSRDGKFYALDVSHIQDANTDLKVNDTIAVTGFLLPMTAVADPQWQAFNVTGVIKVNTLLRTTS